MGLLPRGDKGLRSAMHDEIVDCIFLCLCACACMYARAHLHGLLVLKALLPSQCPVQPLPPQHARTLLPARCRRPSASGPAGLAYQL